VRTSAWFWIATGLGLGLSPIAPGTLGSLLGLALAYPAQHLSGPAFWLAYCLVSVALCGAGVISATWLCRRLGAEDPPAAVIDEVTAQFMITALLPPGLWPIVVSFLLFRLFDITKAFPSNLAERLPEGWGVMADDLVAGIYSLAAYYVLAKWMPALRG